MAILDRTAESAPQEVNQSRLARLRQWQGHLSLRVKGVISLIVVVVYVSIMTAMVTQERLKLPAIVQDLERVHKIEEQMVQVNMQVARAIIATSEASANDQGDPRTRQLFMELTPLDSVLASVSRQLPRLRPYQDQLATLTRNIAHAPSKQLIDDMRATLHRLAQELGGVTQGLRGEKQKLLTNYQLVHDKITLETMFFLFLGVVVVGAVMTIFFTRLTWDIRRAGLRAMAIVKGYRGKPLAVTRGDEVGGLMRAINQMQSELRERERQLELSRQQQFHHEKMAAVGSLAAAVAHEINNPIMAISGLADVLRTLDVADTAKLPEEYRTVPAMILEQAKRIATITRHISEFAAPQSPEPQLTDLNGIIRNTANFVRFDQRYRRIELVVDEDLQLPPIHVVADHVMQVLINLLINAADAAEDVEDRKPKVTVRTSQQGKKVDVLVEDNGCGMSAETLAHACDEFYTTKPRGKGSGLGLFLSKNLVEQNGGSLSIESVPNSGTRVRLTFAAAEVPEN
jgi:signal transduction histidine kinase